MVAHACERNWHTIISPLIVKTASIFWLFHVFGPNRHFSGLSHFNRTHISWDQVRIVILCTIRIFHSFLPTFGCLAARKLVVLVKMYLVLVSFNVLNNQVLAEAGWRHGFVLTVNVSGLQLQHHG